MHTLDVHLGLEHRPVGLKSRKAHIFFSICAAPSLTKSRSDLYKCILFLFIFAPEGKGKGTAYLDNTEESF